eukprot:TRINITY_DN27636_c0_g1_i1.p1 TRINITY_DN27636_c0_g1~~TRINITY_DN27636_c0_g1_i1.p1  ORF type:complete len:305 (+),score=4.17 TRINITY_DN27636_c0_g1_i1:60-917(+)
MAIFATEMITIDHSGKVHGHSGKVSSEKRSFLRRETLWSKRRKRRSGGSSVLKSTPDPSQPGADLSAQDAPWLDLRGRKAIQSDTYSKRGAAFAIDGKDNVDMNRCCCIPSASASASWWEVDLGGYYHIAALQVLRRAFEEMVPLPTDEPKTTTPEKLKKEIRCESTGRKIKLRKSSGSKVNALQICEVKVRATLVRTWTLVSHKGVCEHYFFLRDRLQSSIRSRCQDNDSNLTLEGCKNCCYRDAKCRTIDYYQDSKVCLRYSARCFNNMTSPTHHGGLSYSLD